MTEASVEYDGFVGDVIGHYITREGRHGTVLQQRGTRVVHVYGDDRVSFRPGSITQVPSLQSPLRDLILQLDAVAQRHPAYSQAADAMRHLREHLSALAFCEETNRRHTADSPAPVYRR